MVRLGKRVAGATAVTIDYKALLARAADRPVSLRGVVAQVLSEDDGEMQDQLTSPQESTFSSFLPHRRQKPAAGKRVQSHKAVTDTPIPERTQDSGITVPARKSSTIPRASRTVDPLINAPNMTHFDELCLDMAKSIPFQNAIKFDGPMLHTAHESSCNEMNLEIPPLFRSLCICDPKIKGHPIRLKSKYFSIGPRGLKVGACEYANLKNDEQSGESCELSSRPDIGGRPKFILEYADWLVNGECGFPTWIMGAQIDVTEIIHELATVSLRQDSEQAKATQIQQCIHQEEMRNSANHRQNDCDSAILITDNAKPHLTPSQLTIHSNTSFLFYSSDPLPNNPSKSNTTIINWLETSCPSPSPPNPPTQTPASAAFRTLTHTIATLHRAALVLAPSADLAGGPRAQPCNYWQIAVMSPALYAQTADRRAALSHTSPEMLQRMGSALARDRPVSFLVKWGAAGCVRRMYCSPMMRGSGVGCWLCFLVEPGVGDLWGGMGRDDGDL